MSEADQPVNQTQSDQQPAPEPQPAPQPTAEQMLHLKVWNKLKNGIKGVGSAADQLLQAPSLVPIYLASAVWGILASCRRLITFQRPKFKEDFTKATNSVPEWPRRILGGSAYAWALLAL